MLAKKPSDSIAVACPRCGHESSIRMHRLGQGQSCPSCGTFFRLNDKGRSVVDWSREKDRSLWRRLTKAGERWGKAARLLLQPLVIRWQSLSPRARGILLVFVPLLGVMIGGAWLWTAWQIAADRAEEPDTLVVRSEVVGRALVYGDPEMLQGFTAPDTIVDAQKWLKQARHDHWGKYDKAGNVAHVRTQLMFKNESSREAGVLCTIMAPQRSNLGNGTATVESVLFWEMARDGKWVFDGSRTWKEFQRSRPD